uniref:Uncharacterized protein n=1 Tax=Setaria viridis TaxID=4556 RepID=A0A4U6U5Y5_SETVI|nr:hypothetical protein SEVIR_6G114875v2 [Setaria viridis]
MKSLLTVMLFLFIPAHFQSVGGCDWASSFPIRRSLI